MMKMPKQHKVRGEKSKIFSEHKEDLYKSGLTDATIEGANLYSLKAKGFLADKGVKSLLVFPYDKNPKARGFKRMKLFPSLRDGNGKLIKYHVPKGSVNHLYIPDNTYIVRNNPREPLYITEGEKKALAVTQYGLPCIGISGLWNWKNKDSDELIEDFNLFNFDNRTIYVIPDNDYEDGRHNGSLIYAVKMLATKLTKMGAKVYLIELPVGDAKGVDDFLCSHPLEDFLELREQARYIIPKYGSIENEPHKDLLYMSPDEFENYFKKANPPEYLDRLDRQKLFYFSLNLVTRIVTMFESIVFLILQQIVESYKEALNKKQRGFVAPFLKACAKKKSNAKKVNPEKEAAKKSLLTAFKKGKVVDVLAMSEGNDPQEAEAKSIRKLLILNDDIVNAYRQEGVSEDTIRFLSLFSESVQKPLLTYFKSLHNQAEELEATIMLWEYIEDAIWKKYTAYSAYDYAQKAVDMQQFVEDPFYLGLRGEVYPLVLQDLCELFDPKKQYVEAILTGSIGWGKAQPYGSQVLTPTGYVNIESLKVGDKVITPQNTIATVLQIHEQGIKDIYEITFNDKTKVQCCKDHLWKISTPHNRLKNKWEIKSLKELIQTKLTYGKWSAGKYFIPITQAVDFPKKEHIIPPYVLGVLLGDGCLKSSVTFTVPDGQISYRVQKELGTKYVVDSLRTKFTYSISPLFPKYRSNGSAVNPIKKELERLNLWGKYSYEKFIPDEYFYDSIENRTALLQGLMDTDGSMGKDNRPRFEITSKKLAEDVTHLVNSLGGVVKKSESICSYKKNGKKVITGQICYKLSINIPLNPFYIERKAKGFSPHTKYLPYRNIVSIQKVGRKRARCISLDDKQGLYLTNNYIVTHNSYMAAIA